jgi:beta-glucosidase
MASTTSTAELRRQLASLLVVRGSGHGSDGQRRYPRWELTNAELQRLLAGGVGGVILLGGSAAELRLRCEQLRRWAAAPLLLCADVEEGVGQRFEGASWLVPPLALGRLHGRDPIQAEALAERYGRCTGRQARLLGLNWVLGPVCDVNNNPANPVINVRAWGETPEVAGNLAAAFVRGCQSEGVLACAKHFPGHGDTTSDSHLELPLLPHSRARLEAVELPPFRAAITAGVASVMTAHLLLPALDPERPATLSAAVLSQLLRTDLGFGGLVVTDALVMEAITAQHGPAEAAVLAFEAGADLILMPADADAAIDGLLQAVQSGRISQERLNASLKRRERALAMGVTDLNPALDDLEQLVNPDELELSRLLLQLSLEVQGGQGTEQGSPPGAPCAGSIPNSVQTAQDSGPAPADATPPRTLPHLLQLLAPQLPPGPGLNLIRLDSQLNAPQLPAMAPALLRPTGAGYTATVLDGRSPSPWSSDPSAPLALERLAAGPVLLQLFVRGNPFRGSAGSDEPWPAVVQQLLTAGRLAGLAVYGSPYLWETLWPLLPPGLPAAYSPGQMPQAQAVLLARLGLAAAALEGGFTD